MNKKETPEVVEVNEIKDNAIATIHNKLIEARYRLTLEEQRVILTLISLVNPDDKKLKKYRIPVQVFSEMIGTKHKDMYSVIDRALEGLLKKPLKIEIELPDGRRKLQRFNWIADGEYIEGQGYFEVSISEKLEPYLIGLKNYFTSIGIKFIYPLRSGYSIRIYELLKQYQNLNKRKFEISELREILGVEPDEYKRFFDFERRVLKPAVKEINEKTDLEVSYTKKRTGRKISHIEFEVKPKNAKIGNTTETTKSPSESIDIQGQKMEKNFNSEDLWKGVLKILEYNYGIHPVDIDFLRDKTRVEYNAKLTPKEIVVFPVEDENLVKGILEEMKPKIDEIVKIETGGTYIFKIGD